MTLVSLSSTPFLSQGNNTLSLGKGKMVEWTTPFTIGITSGEYLSTPIIPVGIHSQTIGIIIPQSTYNVVGGGGIRATYSLKALLVVYPSCLKNTVATIDLDISNFRLPPHPLNDFKELLQIYGGFSKLPNLFLKFY
jgi:hypothetical protein